MTFLIYTAADGGSNFFDGISRGREGPWRRGIGAAVSRLSCAALHCMYFFSIDSWDAGNFHLFRPRRLSCLTCNGTIGCPILKHSQSLWPFPGLKSYFGIQSILRAVKFCKGQIVPIWCQLIGIQKVNSPQHQHQIIVTARWNHVVVFILLPRQGVKIQCQVEESGYDRALATADISQPVADASTRIPTLWSNTSTGKLYFIDLRDQYKANAIAYSYCVISLWPHGSQEKTVEPKMAGQRLSKSGTLIAFSKHC